MTSPIGPHPNAGHGHFVRSPEFLTVHDTIANARVGDDDLPFHTLPAAKLEDKSQIIEDAIKKYKQEHGLDVNDIPFIGLPRTFWYWTANMWHYNRALVMMPAAITEPVDAKHVQVAVQIAKYAGVQVQARSGGHSYGGYGWGGRDGAFVIGLKHLNKVTIDKTSMTATIQPGALLGDVTRIMKNAGVMTPHGICPQVGVGGHCTIGGQGPSSRMYGMMVDQIVSFDIVLADGRYVQGVTKDHPELADLFWAVRGAAASFGIVTQFVVKIYPDLTDITHWTYEVTEGSTEQLSNAYDAFQEWASDPNLSEKFSSTCIITKDRMAVERTFFGTPQELEQYEAIDELKKRLDVDGVTVKVQTHFFNRYAGALIHWLEDRALSLGGGIPAKFYVKSLVLRADQPITPELSTKLFNYINDESNQPDLALWFILSDLQGGESNNPKYKETSCYGHRDGLLFFQFYAIDANLLTSTFNQKIRDFVQGMYDVVKGGIPGLEVRVYPGYVDPDLGPECEEIYWGENAGRLRSLKSKYDPNNMFANPQSVRPEATSPVAGTAPGPPVSS